MEHVTSEVMMFQSEDLMLSCSHLKKKLCFLWDVDGTIVDSKEFAYSVYNDVLKILGKQTFTSKEFSEFFSSDYQLHLSRLGIKSEKEINFLVNTWNQRLLTDKHKFRLHNGILDILRYLNENSYEMGIVSSTSKLQLQVYFDMFKIDRFFKVIIAREDVDKQKPSPKPFLLAAKKLGYSPKNCIVIDDMEDGIKAAKKMGAIAIGVTWGFHTYEKISKANPDFIATNTNHLKKIITKKLGC